MQFANISIKVSDEFMEAVKNDDDWQTINRSTQDVCETYKARWLFDKICNAAWHKTKEPEKARKVLKDPSQKQRPIQQIHKVSRYKGIDYYYVSIQGQVRKIWVYSDSVPQDMRTRFFLTRCKDGRKKKRKPSQ